MKRLLVLVLGLTLFLSAFLLFWCQPMVGKMVLPFLGGTAAVWTTCLLFFQATLLGGYIYAHVLGRIAKVRLQIPIHMAVLMTPLAFLPVAFNGGLGTAAFAHPEASLLQKLLFTVGVPLFVISATAPLLQNWLGSAEHASAGDPYFLYAASNAGSLLALLAYPFLVEPRIGVAAQSSFWTAGYAGLIGMMAISSGLVWRHTGSRDAEVTVAETDVAEPPPGALTRTMWVVPAFVASALMLAVTNHITSNLASAPFLWILPLAIYLLTFIVAFSETLRFGSARVSRLIPVVMLALFPLVSADVIAPPGLNWILIAFHLVLLYAGALLCHARLAESRPPSRYLTEFYFWVALGGVLGGIFTATLSPMLFRTILEYPILVAAVAFLRRPEEKGYAFKNVDWIYPALMGVVVATVWFMFRRTRIDSDVSIPAFVHTALLFVAYRWRTRPIRFALALTVLMIAYSMILPRYIEGATRLYVTRDFFGVKKIVQNGNLRSLLHGDTTHGVEDMSRAGSPTSYYHPSGSVADILQRMGKPLPRVAVLGLGTGTMAAYGNSDRHITFFEIDPQVDEIARAYFTFVPKCRAACDVIIGDGRLELQRLPDHSFDLVMLDAFSSDAIPTHLASKEALQMYLTKIAPDGILLFHVSNRYLNVEKLVAQLVLDAGLVAFQRIDQVDASGPLAKEGKTSTNHIIVARRVEDLGHLPELPGWKRLTQAPGIRVWTDDYSSLLDLIRWH